MYHQVCWRGRLCIQMYWPLQLCTIKCAEWVDYAYSDVLTPTTVYHQVCWMGRLCTQTYWPLQLCIIRCAEWVDCVFRRTDPYNCVSSGVLPNNPSLTISDLTDVRQLDALVRSHVLLAELTGRDGACYADILLQAYGYLIQLWKVSWQTETGLSQDRLEGKFAPAVH